MKDGLHLYQQVKYCDRALPKLHNAILYVQSQLDEADQAEVLSSKSLAATVASTPKKAKKALIT